MKKILLVLCLMFFLAGCKDVKLEDGQNAIVTFKNEEGISANDLFEVLKDKYGADELVNIIDTFLLEKEYDESAEEKSYINQVNQSVKDSVAENSMNYEDYIKSYYGCSTENEFRDYIRLSYRRNLYTKDYAKTLVTDKQIEDYYNTTTIGDITASHILIMPDATSDSTTEEQKEAETKAENLAKEIIKKLDSGEDFATLAKEYSDDTASATNGGVLDPFNRGTMDKNFEDAAVKLEVGKYSKTPVKSSYGYHIIYKTAQAEKPTLENSKSTIIETIATENVSSNNTLYLDAIKNLREKNDMKIVDTGLNSKYDELMTELFNSYKKQ